MIKQKHIPIQEWIKRKLQKPKTGLILGQNCVGLWNAALDDLFFFKKFFYQKPCKYTVNIGVAQIRGAFSSFFIGKKCLFISLPDAAFNLKKKLKKSEGRH